MEEEKTFLELFEANVRRSPEKTAIVDRDGERRTTYGALDELSGRICTALKKRGVGKGDIIPIYLDRKMEFIAAEIGILKCGAAFVALTLEYPQARVEYIRKDCGGAFVLDEALLAEALLEEPSEAVAVTPKDPAFAVYTSGSTGNPKGILHTHKSLASSVRRHSKVLETTPEDIQLSCGPFSFIVMAVDVYLPLGMGYTTHILPEEKRKNIRKIEAYILEHKITVSFISPQMLKMLSVKHSSLRAIATGSERVSRITGDGYRIFNMFGCSETAGVATAFCIDQQYDNTPIGKAAPEIQALLLDDAGNPVPQGEEGELCIVGDIASQYINLPEQTKKAFVVQEDGRVLFHTNDICRALPDGNLVYVNRKDWMVKINGQRVETGEIEAVLSDIPQVDTAAVKGFQNDYGQTYLCGFYTVKVPVEEAKVRAVLEEKLPEYMIPQHLVQLEKMPVNQNGKLDRKQLKAPDTGKMQREYRKPENEKQAAVCRAFEKVLNLEKVGILDNFFELGGDSIQAMMLSCELNDISVDYIYEGKTPEKIAEFYEETKRMQVNAREDEKFQNQFDEQGRMRILAGMRYYKKTEDENNMPRTTLLLKEEVDPACLEYAAQMTFPRYKVHSFCIEQDETQYYLKVNKETPIVHKNDGSRQIVGGKENHGYLTRIGYSGCEISIDMFHGVTDGRGTLPFIQTLMYYYCEKKYGLNNPDIPGLILRDTPEDPREYADCVLFLPEEDVKPSGKYEYSEAFALPDPIMDSPWECKHYQLKVNAEELEQYIRQNETSASGLFALFVNRVIADQNICGARPVIGAMAIDARKAYHAEATMQCCVGTLPVYYDQELAGMPLKEQLRKTREIVMEQAKPENILSAAIGTKRFNEKMAVDYPKLQDKIDFCRKVNEMSGRKFTYGISYIGEFKLGEGIDEHILEISPCLSANTLPIIIEILKFKGEYVLTYMSHLEKDRYVHALKELFITEGISCTCVQKENFKECIAQF